MINFSELSSSRKSQISKNAPLVSRCISAALTVRTHTHTHTHTRAHTHTHTHTHARTHTRAHTHTLTHTHTQVRTYTQTHTHTFNTKTHMYIDTPYIHIYMYTHINSYHHTCISVQHQYKRRSLKCNPTLPTRGSTLSWQPPPRWSLVFFH